MKIRIALALGLLVAFVAGAWMALRPPEFPEHAPATAAAPSAMPEVRAAAMVAPTKLAAASVLAIDPRANPPKKGGAATRATLFAEFLGAKAYRPIYDRLKSSPEGQTPEGWYVMYEMLRKCATITERTTRQPIVRTT